MSKHTDGKMELGKRRVLFVMPDKMEDVYHRKFGHRVCIAFEGDWVINPSGDDTWMLGWEGQKPWFVGHDLRKAQEQCAKLNANNGISPEDASNIIKECCKRMWGKETLEARE